MKRGISLVVLVITIIVMTILAGVIILSLSNAGIIAKAEEAVDKTNLSEVQHLATLIWSEKYLEQQEDGAIDEQKLAEDVKTALAKEGITEEEYIITVTASGVEVRKGKIITFYVQDDYDEIELKAEAGMTWLEWVNSEYNILGATCSNEDSLVSYAKEELPQSSFTISWYLDDVTNKEMVEEGIELSEGDYWLEGKNKITAGVRYWAEEFS